MLPELEGPVLDALGMCLELFDRDARRLQDKPVDLRLALPGKIGLTKTQTPGQVMPEHVLILDSRCFSHPLR